MKTVKIGGFDLRGPPYFILLAKQLQAVVFEASHKEGKIKKNKVKILFFIPNEFIICQYEETE